MPVVLSFLQSPIHSYIINGKKYSHFTENKTLYLWRRPLSRLILLDIWFGVGYLFRVDLGTVLFCWISGFGLVLLHVFCVVSKVLTYDLTTLFTLLNLALIVTISFLHQSYKTISDFGDLFYDLSPYFPKYNILHRKKKFL